MFSKSSFNSTKNNTQLSTRIQQKLSFLPGIDSSQIIYSVDENIVSVYGSVGSYAEKFLIKRAISQLNGVKEVIDEMIVKQANQDSLPALLR